MQNQVICKQCNCKYSIIWNYEWSEDTYSYEYIIGKYTCPSCDYDMLYSFISAARDNDISEMKTFLDKGLDPDIKHPMLGNAFSIALANKAKGKQIVELLIQFGSDINHRDKNIGSTKFHDAISYNRLDIAELLIEHGAKINIWERNVITMTPLHIACKEGNIDAVKFLIDKGAKINLRNSEGDTPLHLATLSCPKNCFTILKILIDAGAKKSIRNKSRNRPVDLCWQEKDKPKRDFLESYGTSKKWWSLFPL